jgi:hypothetical protein
MSDTADNVIPFPEVVYDARGNRLPPAEPVKRERGDTPQRPAPKQPGANDAA